MSGILETVKAMLSAVFNRFVGNGLGQNFLTLTVRYNGQDYSISVLETCTVADLKNLIKDKIGNISEDNLSLIIGGTILQDVDNLRDCGVGDQTMLHAFRKKESHISTGSSNTPRCQYYVYCKNCRCLNQGKLRVKCSTCKEGVFITDRGPDGWHDITEANRITGQCQGENCEGKIAEFYFKCSKNHSDNSSTAVGLRHIRPNTRQVDCIGCAEIQTPVLVYPCEAGHVTCLECFKLYCNVMLNDRRFIENEEYGYTLPCPAKCENSFIQESHHFCLMGEEQYNKYKEFATEEFVLKSGGIFCPGRDCGNPIFPDINSNKKQHICFDCRYEFCVDCRSPVHDGDCSMQILQPAVQDTPVDEAMAERARWERQSLLTINKTTKLCPNKDCRTPTEKDGGCSHMTCSRCDLNWCWVCEIEWNNICQGDHWFD